MAWLYYHDGNWTPESPRIIGPGEHAFWMASVVFDGARAIRGVAPDLAAHCARLIRSAHALMLAPKLTADEVEHLCCEAIRRFPADAELYLRPSFFARTGFLLPDPESTDFALAVGEIPWHGLAPISAHFSPRQRPAASMAPTDAKAACLYPNSQRILAEARAAGFTTAVVCDAGGLVAEFATANLMFVLEGEVRTPAPNGTFLDGITRNRVTRLLREAGIPVHEAPVTPEDVRCASEIFSVGNIQKITPVTRLEQRELPVGPVTRQAHALYKGWMEGQPAVARAMATSAPPR
jgi:branched-chain amino acid aminotransferase